VSGHRHRALQSGLPGRWLGGHVFLMRSYPSAGTIVNERHCHLLISVPSSLTVLTSLIQENGSILRYRRTWIYCCWPSLRPSRLPSSLSSPCHFPRLPDLRRLPSQKDGRLNMTTATSNGESSYGFGLELAVNALDLIYPAQGSL
jgi:hypothetical protein